MNEGQEALLGRIIDLLAERSDKHAVLRGGMVLRVLGCERMTNDLDYVFVPFRSRKDIVSDVIKTLQQIEGSQVTHSLNSKVQALTDEDIARSLSDYLPPTELPALTMRFRAETAKLV